MARQIEQRQRNKHDRQTRKKIIFAFEGKNKTEELYFKHYRKRNAPYSIIFADDRCTDPVNLVKSIIKSMKENGASIKNGDKMYCVFDGDIDARVEKQPKIYEANDLAKKKGIEMIISIPSFEFWYRLHFGYTTKKYNSNHNMLEDIKAKIPDYDKNVDVFDVIKDNTQIAIDNSMKLEKSKDTTNHLDIESNIPYTAVYKPVKFIIDNNT